MCTAVVGGSIQRAATSISAASDQSTTTPMRSQRINDRRNTVRDGALASVFVIAGFAIGGVVMSVSGMAVTFCNDIPRRVAAGGRSCLLARANTERCGELRPRWRFPRFEPEVEMKPQAVSVRHQDERERNSEEDPEGEATVVRDSIPVGQKK